MSKNIKKKREHAVLFSFGVAFASGLGLECISATGKWWSGFGNLIRLTLLHSQRSFTHTHTQSHTNTTAAYYIHFSPLTQFAALNFKHIFENNMENFTGSSYLSLSSIKM